MNDIRCISLLQPYASAIVSGPKRVENRPRSLFQVPPGGIWVGIHASKGWWDVDWSLWRREWASSSMLKSDYPRGCVVGVAHFSGVRTFHEAVPVDLIVAELGRWAFGPVCYLIDDARALPTPIPAKGALGLWRPQPDVAAALAALVSR